MSEIIYAGRRLWKDRWSTAAAILVSALGAGLNTALFAIVYGVLLRPLPYSDADRLAVMDVSVSVASLPEWRAALPAFSSVSGYASEGFTVRGISEPRFLPVAVVDETFFATLGTTPAVGRVFATDDGPAVAVVSERFARGIDGSVASLIGRSMTIGDASVTVIGVMPARFAFPSDGTDVWIPAAAVRGVAFDRSNDERRLRLFGRLSRGTTIAAARVQMERARTALDPQARHAEEMTANVELLRDRLLAPVRPMLLAFTAAAAIVLLVACANVATILVGRTVARRRELAIRMAIGAGRVQILMTTFAEALAIAAFGGVAGLALASVAVVTIRTWAAGILPRLADVRLDWPVLLFAVPLTAVSAAAAALPAARAIEPPATMLRTAAGDTPRGVKVRTALAVLQVALSVVLLTAGTLLTRTMQGLLRDDVGVERRGAIVSQLMLGDAMNFKAADGRPRLDRILERVRAIPDVVAAGAGSSLPPNHATLVMTVNFRSESGSSETPELTFASVTPGYLEALGTRLSNGRYFDETDLRRGDLVVMLSESAARALAPGMDTAAHQLSIFLPGLRARGKATVIGVVADIKYSGLADRPGPAVYVLWQELPASQLYVAARTRGDTRLLESSLRSAIHEADARTPLMPVRTLEEVMERSVADRRLRAVVGAGVAILAFAIALVGLAGGLGRVVVERRRELAIRAALGATPSRAAGSVMLDAGVIVLLGVLAGVAAAWLTSNVVSAFVWGVSARDPVTFAAVATVVAGISLLVCYIPARLAARANPLELMRAE
jgi:predicted permease